MENYLDILGVSYGNITRNPMGISTIRFQNTITDKIIMYQDAGNIGLGVTNGYISYSYK